MALKKYPRQRLFQIALISTQLTLPSGIQERFSFVPNAVEGVVVYEPAQDARFVFIKTGEGKTWLTQVAASLKRARVEFEQLLRSESQLDCDGFASDQAALSVAFFLMPPEKLLFPEGANPNERMGFDHPANPGPLIQLDPWDSETARHLMVHEAVHRWCRSSNHSFDQHWLQEGAADWISYRATGYLPQSSITRYFQAPNKPTLYGSSFLWFLAREQGRHGQSFIESLAALHLGMRPDLVFGKSTSPVAGPSAGLAPISRTCHSLPYTVLPWGEIVLRHGPWTKPASTSLWTWCGPMPSITASP